jgi:glutamyl-Q tRNA(Asp) synthetase
MTVVSRFAPAPTGHLHLGHVVNAIYVWGVTRAMGGRVLLRIEDHDGRRSRPEYERAILEDLDWLGFSADEPFVRQSDRHAIYAQALDALERQSMVYACACSRAEIAAHAEEARGAHPVGAPGDQELWYPGTCRGRRLRPAPGLGTRVRLAPSIERFRDVRHGVLEQRPDEQCGDLLVRDRDGFWTYQFAVSVDDFRQGITLVVRGDDLLASTGRQIQLARLLGRDAPPAFFHHSLIMKSRTQKLSKSDGDTGVRDLRARGWSPGRVIGHAAALARLTDTDEPRELSADEVVALMAMWRVDQRGIFKSDGSAIVG